ncbi:MAG: TetR/AcrR family transcriptional regulator [Myxococcota bacterium]
MALVTRDDWCVAALLALGEGGTSAVRVEPLARTLGVTKGSFYHHFKNRDALFEAAMQLWRSRGTLDVIDAMKTHTDPRQKLSALLGASLDDLAYLRAEAGLMAAAAANHPIVAPVYAQVSAARLAYLHDVYCEIGVTDPLGWARLAYAAYLGSVSLAAMQPPLLTVSEAPVYLQQIRARLVPDP